LGNDYTRAQCKAETLETFKISHPTASNSYETGGPTAYSYYAVNSTGGTLGQTGSFDKIGTMECPAGTVQNSAQTGCNPDPASVCQAKAGDTTPITFNRNQQVTTGFNVDGCQVVIESGGVNACLPDGLCGGTGKFTGEVATTGAPSTGDPLPDPLPPNPIVVSDSVPTVDGVPQIPPGEVATTEGGYTYGYHMEDGVLVIDTIQNPDKTVTTQSTEAPRPGGGIVETYTVTEATSGGYQKQETVSAQSGGTIVYNSTTVNNPPSSSTSKGETVTYPDGSQSGVCNGPNCPGQQTPGTGTGGDGEGDGNGGNKWGVGGCNSQPVCTGDPVQCAQAVQAWRTMCQIKADNERIFGTPQENAQAKAALEAARVDTPQQMEQAIGTNIVDVSEYANFVTDYFPAPTGCPSDRVLNLMGHTITIKIEPICTFADYLRPVILAFAYFWASLILYRGLTR